jgi:hypothetical protein
MQRRMVVLDVTRMSGDRVCVGGYLVEGEPIRPVCFPYGPDNSWLTPAPGMTVQPFSVLELHVGGKPGSLVRPHTEDRLVPQAGHVVVGMLEDADRREWLEWQQARAVSEIFGAEVCQADEQPWGRYVRSGEGERSLGTIRVGSLHEVFFIHDELTGKYEYRIKFQDESGDTYRLAVVDLAFRAHLDKVAALEGRSSAGARVKADLQNQELFLRIGLARGWPKFPDRCYLQVTGVYGFPRG